MYIRRSPIRSSKFVNSLRLQPYTTSPQLQIPRKGAEDRNSINTDATEYSKSGTDDSAASQSDPAFNPSKTDPEDQLSAAGQGVESNPLDVSPANKDISNPRDQREGGAEKAPDKTAGSGRGSPTKKKPVS
ncbi:MAG: hypothetical protein Q9160_005678 [Pyrenula sp. 1 TL-2023]